MKIAERFGQPPQDVAAWPDDWLGVCLVAMSAENGAQEEIQKRQERQARMRRAAGRG